VSLISTEGDEEVSIAPKAPAAAQAPRRRNDSGPERPERSGRSRGMQITSGMVKELREKTGAGLMDCKAALTASGGDMEGRSTPPHERPRGGGEEVFADRLRGSRLRPRGGNSGALVEVNCETDFVARTDDFVALAKEVAALINARPRATSTRP